MNSAVQSFGAPDPQQTTLNPVKKTGMLMFGKIIAGRPYFIAVVVSLLAACASPPPTVSEKPTPDQAVFASRKFAPQYLAPAVARRIPTEAGRPRFGVLTIATEVDTIESGGRLETSNVVLRFTDAGNGLMQRVAELSKVGIAFGSTYSLTYKGLADLKLQDVPLRRTVTRPVIEWKEVSRFDAIPSDPGKEFSFHYATGLESQTSNFLPIQNACKSTRKVPASTLHSRIPGDMLELECRLSSGNALQSGSKWALLLAYGVAVEMEHTRATSRSTTRIADFSVRN